jgi:hypothetical protein
MTELRAMTELRTFTVVIFKHICEMWVLLLMTAGFENGEYYFFAARIHNGTFKRIFRGGQYFLTLNCPERSEGRTLKLFSESAEISRRRLKCRYRSILKVCMVNLHGTIDIAKKFSSAKCWKIIAHWHPGSGAFLTLDGKKS